MFIGPNQARIDINVTTALQALGTRAGYIRVSAAGRNALDFHIAYYLGRLAASEPLHQDIEHQHRGAVSAQARG